MDIARMRDEYESHGIDFADLDPDPFVAFRSWLAVAVEAEIVEPNAMVMNEIDADGSIRAVVVASGKPGTFIAGADLKQVSAVDTVEEASRLSHNAQQTLARIADSRKPFVAAIPKRLLANPNGPIAYVGHVDTAWLHGFDDPSQPIPDDLYSRRLEPLLGLIDSSFLRRTAAGFGMRPLADRSSMIAGEVAILTNRVRGSNRTLDDLEPAELDELADLMIRRNDAAWFLMYGDPGVRVTVGD